MTCADSNPSDDLLEVLSHEVDACRQMVALTLREQSTLKAGDVAALAAVVHDKETVLESLNIWHTAHERIVHGLVQDEKPSEAGSLLPFPADFHNDTLQELAPMQQELAELLRQLLALNHGNRMLIKADLAQIETTFSFLAQVAGPNSDTYTIVGGSHSKPATGNMLNWKA